MTVPVPSPYPESSQATTTLVLAIVGVVVAVTGFACCGIISPLGSVFGGIAWYLARKEIAAIETGRRNPSQLGLAKGGMVTGIVATVLGLLAFIFWVAIVGFAISGGVARG